MYQTDTGRPSEQVVRGFHVETQVDKDCCKTLISKSTPKCQKNSTSGLEVMLENLLISIPRSTSNMKEKTESFTSLQSKT